MFENHQNRDLKQNPKNQKQRRIKDTLKWLCWIFLNMIFQPFLKIKKIIFYIIFVKTENFQNQKT